VAPGHKNPGHHKNEAERRFKQLSEAYEVSKQLK
jgi:DnaJ-class molecular chaperone